MHTFPSPQRMDRVIILDANSGFYGQVGTLVHAAVRQRSHVVPESNPRVEISIDLANVVHERYQAELNLKPLAQAKEEQAQAREAEVASAPPVERVAPVKTASGPSKRGKARSTNIVTNELGDKAIAMHKAEGKGVVLLASELNCNPNELSLYFKSQGVVVKKGRKSKAA